jgi:hypothetical protein
MNRYIPMSLWLLITAFSSMEAKSIGPFPLPTNPQLAFQTNPTAYMTSNQRAWVKYGFDWIQGAFQQNRKVCNTRAQCLNLDLNSLATYIQRYPAHPESTMLKNISNLIRQDSMRQKFVSQWIVFQNLSPMRQTDYRAGLRITPIQPQNVLAPWGMTFVSTPAFFNQDDVFTEVLQEIDHFHKSCSEYVGCLRGDLQIIRNVSNRLASNDPLRTALYNPYDPNAKSLYNKIAGAANNKLFDTFLYLQLYNPLNASWNDTFLKHKAKKFAGYGYAEWKNVEKGASRPSRWQYPRVTNGTPTTQYQTYGTPQTPYQSPGQGSFSTQKPQKESNFLQKLYQNKDFIMSLFKQG